MTESDKNINIEGDVNVSNANFATQNFYGTVNIGSPTEELPPTSSWEHDYTLADRLGSVGHGLHLTRPIQTEAH